MFITVHHNQTASEYAAKAAESIRVLNYLTSDTSALRHPHEMWEALLNLALLTKRLERTMHQVGRIQLEWITAGIVDPDSRKSERDIALGTTLSSLSNDATQAARELAHHFERAAEALATLNTGEGR